MRANRNNLRIGSLIRELEYHDKGLQKLVKYRNKVEHRLVREVQSLVVLGVWEVLGTEDHKGRQLELLDQDLAIREELSAIGV